MEVSWLLMMTRTQARTCATYPNGELRVRLDLAQPTSNRELVARYVSREEDHGRDADGTAEPAADLYCVLFFSGVGTASPRYPV
jgi:hypothetical protein